MTIGLLMMIKLYKAFILPHFEYASPLFIGLSKCLSAKLESTNAFALRTLLNYSKHPHIRTHDFGGQAD